jgi:hypothetical protein
LAKAAVLVVLLAPSPLIYLPDKAETSFNNLMSPGPRMLLASLLFTPTLD